MAWWGAVWLLLVRVGPLRATPPLRVGDVAPTDILAPTALEYVSEVLTRQQQAAAEAAVGRVYDPYNPYIGRQQIERLQAALAYIDAVRQDPYTPPEQKIQDLLRMEPVQLTPSQARRLLRLSDEAWLRVRQQAVQVLAQVMQEPIRDDYVDNARLTIPARLPLDLPPDLADLVVTLASAYVAPNVRYNPQRTAQAQAQARANVTPVVRTFRAGEIIVPRGKVLDEADIEALEKFGLLKQRSIWQVALASASLTATLGGLSALYVFATRWDPSSRERLTLSVTFIGLMAFARIILPGQAVLPYLYPFALYGLLVTLFWGAERGLLFSGLFSLASLYGFPRGLELTAYHGLAAWAGLLALGRGERLSAFMRAGLTMAAVQSLALLAFRTLDPVADGQPLGLLILAALSSSGVATSLALLAYIGLAPALGRITAFHLLDLARPDHPLLQYLLQRAPGTYQHSLLVANLAEQAAERIDADPLLTRVGALYHDVGKAERPLFFIENRPPGMPDPHQNLTPQESSAIIRAHVTDGLRLARQHRLPQRIQDFIAEHHGTTLTRYQYAQALKQAKDPSQVNPDDFRYPGPKPRSKETAILMLADGCEARARAERPDSLEAIRALVHDQIQRRVQEGQLDDAPLTLRDLQIIEEAFIDVLQGMYHQRIDYPKIPPRADEGKPRMDTGTADKHG